MIAYVGFIVDTDITINPVRKVGNFWLAPHRSILAPTWYSEQFPQTNSIFDTYTCAVLCTTQEHEIGKSIVSLVRWKKRNTARNSTRSVTSVTTIPSLRQSLSSVNHEPLSRDVTRRRATQVDDHARDFLWNGHASDGSAVPSEVLRGGLLERLLHHRCADEGRAHGVDADVFEAAVEGLHSERQQAAFMFTFSGVGNVPADLVNPMTANLLVTYGSDFGAARKLLTLPRLTMLPRPRLRVPERGEKNDRGSCVVIALETARVQLKEPLTLMLWQRSNSAVVVSYDRSRSDMETLKYVIA